MECFGDNLHIKQCLSALMKRIVLSQFNRSCCESVLGEYLLIDSLNTNFFSYYNITGFRQVPLTDRNPSIWQQIFTLAFRKEKQKCSHKQRYRYIRYASHAVGSGINEQPPLRRH